MFVIYLQQARLYEQIDLYCLDKSLKVFDKVLTLLVNFYN